MDLSTHNFQRILLIKPSSLGDIIHALPVLNGLRDRFPRARISWLVNSEYVALLEDHPQLDEVIPFDRRKLKSLRGLLSSAIGLSGFARELRRREFDLALDLQGLFRSGLMTFASGAAVRLGFKPAREGAGMFYNHRIPVPKGALHAVDKNYLAGTALGFRSASPVFHLPVSESARSSVTQKLAAGGLETGNPYVVVVPGSRWETKNWWPERFGESIDRIQNELGSQVVISGTAAESDLCRRISRFAKPTPVDLSGKIDLPELVALLDGAALVLCNDSAPLHIASALARPVVSIFGPTDARRSGPHGQMDSVLQADLPCISCYLRRLSRCPNQHQCMSDISVDNVLSAVRVRLEV